MVYQIGTQGVKNFENTLQLIEEKNYEAAKKEALNSKWAQQTPERAKLVTDSFLTKEYTNPTNTLPIPPTSVIGPKFDSTYVNKPVQTQVATKVNNLPEPQQKIVTAAVEEIANEPGVIDYIKSKTTETVKEAEIMSNTIIEWGKRFAVKQGLLNPNDVETEKVYEVHTPNVHTYTPPSQKQKERDNITSKKYEKIGVTSNGHLMYAYTFDLRQGNDYVPIKNVGNSKLTDKYENVEGIAHFILDADLTSGYQHEYTKNYVNQQLKSKKPIASPGSSVEEAYVPVVEKRNNLVNVTYKPQSQVTKNDNVPSILRQYRFTDLEWDKPGKTSPGGNFKETVSGLLTKDGNETTLIYPTADKNKESYGKFGGASVVFIIPEKNIAIDFAGSIKQIKQMGEKLSQQYRINLNNLIIGYHDIGSFSAKPAANSKGELKFSQWSGFNPEPFTGGALAIPKQN